MSWVPTTDFEDEVVSMQADYNFVYGHLGEQSQEVFYPRPKEHLAYAAKKQQKSAENVKPPKNSKLNVIANVQRIAHTKPLGEQPTLNDWDTSDNVERETIAMIRHFGFGPSIEEPFDQKCTIATLPVTDKMRINCNGNKRLPILFDDKFFELKPRDSNSSSSELENANSAESSSIFSEVSKCSSNEVTSDDERNTSASVSTTSASITHFDTASELAVAFESLDAARTVTDSTGDGTRDDSYVTADSDKFIPSLSWHRSDYGRHDKNSSRNRHCINSNESKSANFACNSLPTTQSHSKKKRRPNQQERRFQSTREIYLNKRCNGQENKNIL